MAVITVLTSCTTAPEKTETSAVLSAFNLDSVEAFIAASIKMYGETFA